MSDARSLIQADPAYLSALGRALYNFAYMEWCAVYCGDKLSPGYVSTVGGKTAGAIAKDIQNLATKILDQKKKTQYEAAAEAFAALVARRNDLMHANPATVDNQQRLVRNGVPWQPSEIDELSDSFAKCSVELGNLYYSIL